MTKRIRIEDVLDEDQGNERKPFCSYMDLFRGVLGKENDSLISDSNFFSKKNLILNNS
jgi:hypothetical protein